MPTILQRVCLWAATAAVLSTLASAQQAKPISNWASLSQLSQGLEIRVTLASGRTLRGFLQSATPDSLTINATTSQETLTRQEVRRVSLKPPGHRGRNTLIGLAIGAVGGLAAGATADAQRHDSWFPNAGKQILVPVGAIIGTVVGVALPTGRWRDVYRAP